MKATIAELNLYPIKGCRGVSLKSAALLQTGLALDGVGHPEFPIGDREWVIVDGERQFLTQREHPRMALIQTRLAGGALQMKAPGMLDLQVPFESEGDVEHVTVWSDTVSAVTQGEVADIWLSNFLGMPARLMRFDPEHKRVSNSKYTGVFEAPYKFADAFALLITSTASLADVNERLRKQGDAPITQARFRPNIVLDGLEAYEEDYISAIRVGGTTIRAVKPCARCTVPGVDPRTGEQSNTVPDLLASYRGMNSSGADNGVIFGVNAIVTAGMGTTLRVGDEVDIDLNV